MELLASRLTRYFLQREYITPEQAQWFQYGLVRRMMGLVAFVILLFPGALMVGFPGAFLYVFVFRFLRERTGGYHAKSPLGCFLASFSAMLIALSLAGPVTSLVVSGLILAASSALILYLAPANNAHLHLSEEELAAIRPRLRIRLLAVVLLGCFLFPFHLFLANCISLSVGAVAAMLLVSHWGFGVQ